VKPDAVAVVEAGYAVERTDDEWLTQICERSYQAFGIGIGCSAYTFDASGTDPVIGAVYSTERCRAHTREVVQGIASAIPPELVRHLHAPAPRVAELSRALGMLVRAHPAAPPQYVPILDDTGIVDYIGVRAGGGDYRGVALSFAVTAEFTGLATHTREALTRVATHLAAAYRLRLQAAANEGPEQAAAVLTPDGRLEHLGADPEAQNNPGSLVDAVRRMERARGPLQRQNGAQGLAAWRALVQGRWSVVDYVDRDGKRFILARRNEPRGRDLLAITDRERQVLELASLGHTNKHIAYELGIAQSTVTIHLQRGLRRLGLRSRAELIGLRAASGAPRSR
jgi:DNA-binding CsgD family transcriptional regulator